MVHGRQVWLVLILRLSTEKKVEFTVVPWLCTLTVEKILNQITVSVTENTISIKISLNHNYTQLKRQTKNPQDFYLRFLKSRIKLPHNFKTKYIRI